VPYRKLFLRLSRNHNCERNEKLTVKITRAQTQSATNPSMHPSGSRGCEPGLAFDGRVLAATACVLPFTSGCITTFPFSKERKDGVETMQSTGWRKPIHRRCGNSRQGHVYSRIADAINAKFGTGYSRNATIGRAKRMDLSFRQNQGSAYVTRRQSAAAAQNERTLCDRVQGLMPIFERAETDKLRCVEIVPRHLALVDLSRGIADILTVATRRAKPSPSAVTQAPGASYCTAHFHLTRGPGTIPERAVGLPTESRGGGVKRRTTRTSMQRQQSLARLRERSTWHGQT